MPDAFCSDWLTFKGKGKEEGVQVLEAKLYIDKIDISTISTQYPDEDIVADLAEFQPDLIDTQATIAAEEVTS